MTLTTARRFPDLLALDTDDANDATVPVRVIVLDGRHATPSIPKAMAQRVVAGGCIVVFTTPRLLEEATAVLEQTGFGQPRFLKTEDGAPASPWGSGQDDTTYAVMARHKKGPFVFNERYHSGRLNGQPVEPNPKVEGELKGAQGSVPRVDAWPIGEQARMRHTLSEVVSIHTLPDDRVAIDSHLVHGMGLGASDNAVLRVLYRTRPPKPALSDTARKRREERDAARAALRAATTNGAGHAATDATAQHKGEQA